jgi:hypothetical protein
MLELKIASPLTGVRLRATSIQASPDPPSGSLVPWAALFILIARNRNFLKFKYINKGYTWTITNKIR